MTTSLQRWIEERQEEYRRQQGGGASYTDRAREAQEAVRADQQVDLITVPRGYSQSTEAAFADAGYDLDEVIPLHGQFEGDADDPLSDPDLGPVIRELRSEARPERPDPRPTQSLQRSGRDPAFNRTVEQAFDRLAEAQERGESVDLPPRLQEALQVFTAGHGRGGFPTAQVFDLERATPEATQQRIEEVLPPSMQTLPGLEGAGTPRQRSVEEILDGSPVTSPEEAEASQAGMIGPMEDPTDSPVTTEQDEEREGFWSRLFDSDTGADHASLASGRQQATVVEPDIQEARAELAEEYTDRIHPGAREHVDPTPVGAVERALTAQEGGGTRRFEQQLRTPRHAMGAAERELEHLEALTRLEGEIESLDDVRELAAGLGMDPDRGPGPLMRFLEVLGRPQRAIVGAITGLAGARLGDDDPDEGSFGLAAERAWDALSGETQLDFFDTDAFEIEQDMSWWEKAGRGVGGFGASVVTDPLAWVTFGTGGIARRAASEVAERSAVSAANRAGFQRLSRDLPERAKRRLLDNVGDDGQYATYLARHTDRARTRGRVAGPDDVTPTDPAEVMAAMDDAGRLGVARLLDDQLPGLEELLLREGLSNLAGGAMYRGASTGLRRQLTDVFGAEDVFNNMPTAVRGGVQATVPFLTRQSEFGRVPRWTTSITPGGGRLYGGEGLSDAVNHVRRAVATSRPGQRWQSMFAGRDADAVKAATVALRQGDEHFAGRAWRTLMQQREANRLRGEFMARRSTRAHLAASTVARHLDETVGADPEQAREAMRIWMNARGSQTYDPWERGLQDLSEASVQAGRRAEEAMHDIVQESFNEVRDMMPTGSLSHYTPRRLSEEVLEEVTNARQAASRHTKSRSGAFAEMDIDDHGNLAVRSWFSPEEVAEEAARRGDPIEFLDDPIELMADYLDAMENVARSQYVFNHLQNVGLIQTAAPATRQVLDDRAVADAAQPAFPAMERASRSVDEMRRAIDEGDFTQADAIFGELTEVIGRDKAAQIADALPRARVIDAGRGRWQVEMDGLPQRVTFDDYDHALQFADRQTLSTWYDAIGDAVGHEIVTDRNKLRNLVDLRNAPLEDADELARHIDSLTSTVGRWANEVDPRRLRESVYSTRRIASEYQKRLKDMGWDELPESAKDAAALRGLAESGAFAPESVVNTMRREFAVRGNFEEMESFLNQVWQPYYTTFKTLATVGRGPGFAIRNALGGMWNGYVVNGASASHFGTAARMMAAEDRGRRRAMREVAELDEVLDGQEIERRVRESIRSEFGRAFKGRGERLYQALETFYDRNLMTGTRVDDLHQQTAVGTTQSVTRMAGGHRQASIMGDSLGPTEAGPLRRAAQAPGRAWRRILRDEELDAARGTRGQQVDAMDPGIRRMLDLDQSVFVNTPRSELGAVQRGVQALSDNPWTRSMSSAAEISERYTRLAPYLKGLDDFGIEDGGRAAAIMVRASQFDYGDLTQFERRVMRNLMPFYTFTRNNVPLQLRGMASSPDRLARLGHFWNVTEETLGDDRWEERLLPRWVRDNLGFVSNVSPADIDAQTGGLLSRAPVLGRMFDSPHPIAVNMSSLPVTDVEKLFGPSGRDEALSMLNPAFKIPVEQLFDVDLFTRERMRPTERAPDFMQDSPTGQRIAEILPGMEVAAGDATVNVQRRPAQAARQALPPVAHAERLLGSTDRYEDRMLTSWMSMMGGMPVSTMDTGQVFWTARRSREELEDEVDRVLGGVRRGDAREVLDEFGADVVQEALETPGLLEQLVAELD